MKNEIYIVGMGPGREEMMTGRQSMRLNRQMSLSAILPI